MYAEQEAMGNEWPSADMVGCMRFESKSTPVALVAGLLIVVLIGFSGCGSDTKDESEAEATSTQTLQVVTQGFASTDELSEYLSETLDDVDVRLESESNPDYDEKRDADRLYVDFASEEKKAADMEATATIVQAASQAAFDYDVLMVSGDVSSGEWSYIYNKDTVEELTEDGTITVADVWGAAEQDFDTIHR
jgi:hypothetical protein